MLSSAYELWPNLETKLRQGQNKLKSPKRTEGADKWAYRGRGTGITGIPAISDTCTQIKWH